MSAQQLQSSATARASPLARVATAVGRWLRGWLYPAPPDSNRDLQRCHGCGNSQEWYVHYCHVCGRALEGHYRRAQEEFAALAGEGAIRGVEVQPQPDACAACRALAGRLYAPAEMSRLPHPGCTHPKGCRCGYSGVGLQHV